MDVYGCQNVEAPSSLHAVNLEERSCPVVETIEGTTPSPEELSDLADDSTEVCGSDGVTYPSLCQLLQMTSNIRVAHAGACERPECGSQEVRECEVSSWLRI